MEQGVSAQDAIKRSREIRERARRVTEMARETRRRAREAIAQSRAFDRALQSHRHVS